MIAPTLQWFLIKIADGCLTFHNFKLTDPNPAYQNSTNWTKRTVSQKSITSTPIAAID